MRSSIQYVDPARYYQLLNFWDVRKSLRDNRHMTKVSAERVNIKIADCMFQFFWFLSRPLKLLHLHKGGVFAHNFMNHLKTWRYTTRCSQLLLASPWFTVAKSATSQEQCVQSTKHSTTWSCWSLFQWLALMSNARNSKQKLCSDSSQRTCSHISSISILSTSVFVHAPQLETQPLPLLNILQRSAMLSLT